MRIAILLDDLGCGGLQRHMAAVARELVARNHIVEVISRKPGPMADHFSRSKVGTSTLETDGVSLHQMLQNVDVTLDAGMVIPSYIRSNKRSPTVSFWWGDHQQEIYRWRDSNGILVCSDRTRAAYVALYPGVAGYLHHIDNPVLTSPVKANNAEWRKCANIDEAAFIVLSLGRYSRIKRYLRLIHEAAPFLYSQPEAVLVIAGETEDAQSGWKSTYSACVELVKELELEDQVRLLPHQDDPAPLLAVANAYVSMSESEGQSLAVSEAMSFGIPVIATAVSGIGRQLGSGDFAAGIIMPVYGPSGLSAHLADLSSSLSRRQELGSVGVRQAQSLSLATHVERVEEVLQTALMRSAIPAPLYINSNDTVSVVIFTYGGIERVSPRVRAYYMKRCLAPYNIRVSVVSLSEATCEQIVDADLVVFHRAAHHVLFQPDQRAAALEAKRLRFLWETSLRICPTLYDMDDYLFVPDSMPHEIADLNLHFVRTATLVIVNSEASARRFKKWTPEVVVIENPVDDLLWSPLLHLPNASRFTVGWVAGKTHLADTEYAADVLLKFFRHRLVSER